MGFKRVKSSLKAGSCNLCAPDCRRDDVIKEHVTGLTIKWSSGFRADFAVLKNERGPKRKIRYVQ